MRHIRGAKQSDVIKKFKLEQELKEAISFITPELDDETIFYALHLALLELVSEKKLAKAVRDITKQAEKKLQEVASLYQQFSLEQLNETEQ